MSGSPVVTAGYSLAAECGSEIIATMLTIYLGEAIIANELLSKTKGARMGWLAVALGFGLSFGVVIMMFGYISAHLNPATCLALWVIGKVDFKTFVALSASEFLGAFLGACLVFLHYIPHFKTVPEPAAHTADELLLRSRDALSPEALSIVSYDTRQQDKRHVKGVKANVEQAIKDVRYYFVETHEAPAEHSDLLEVALGPSELKSGPSDLARGLRRRSVQVCDVHRRLKDMSIEEFKEKLHLKTGADGMLVRSASLNIGELSRVGNRGEDGSEDSAQQQVAAAAAPAPVAAPVPTIVNGRAGPTQHPGNVVAPMHIERGSAAEDGMSRASVFSKGRMSFLSSDVLETKLAHKAQDFKEAYHKHLERFGSKQSQLYDAAVVADQNAKLSIFCTRPAIYSPVFNFLCEMMCTCMLVFGALMMYARRDLLTGEFKLLFQSFEGMWVGFFVFVAILGLGGPTGIAANPARDIGPRFAHYILPIAGKGPSEWFYSWVPFFATFAGGALAGAFYILVQKMNHSKAV